MELINTLLGRDGISGIKISVVKCLERIGSDYGGWIIPTHLIDENSICYCAGVGEDVTFDLGLIGRFNCTVFAYDPTPRAIQYVRREVSEEPRFNFYPIGLWDREETVRFYAPSNPDHVSYSALNLQRTDEYFEAECKRLSSIMRENRHDRIDLLKLDIEGAEYRVIDSIVKDGLDIRIICVEYDEAFHPLDAAYKRRIRESVNKLVKHGYRLVAVDRVCNYTFVRRTW